MIEQKKLSQRVGQVKTCGSTFKNLVNKKKAWEIIKEAGCEKFSVGVLFRRNTVIFLLITEKLMRLT